MGRPLSLGVSRTDLALNLPSAAGGVRTLRTWCRARCRVARQVDAYGLVAAAKETRVKIMTARVTATWLKSERPSYHSTYCERRRPE